MIKETQIQIPGLLAFIAFNMTTIPCFAAVAAAKGELGSKKCFNNTLIFWLVTSYIVSCAIYTIGTWWWTSFIWATIFIIVALTIRLCNKNKLKKGA